MKVIKVTEPTAYFFFLAHGFGEETSRILAKTCPVYTYIEKKKG